MKGIPVRNMWRRFKKAVLGMGNPLGQLPARLSTVRRRERRLRLTETLSLGEKRFLALVEIGDQEFLIGGASNSVNLLGELPADEATARKFPGVRVV